MGPAHRRPDPESPARGPRRRPAPARPELSDRSDLRARDGRTGPGVSRFSRRSRAPGTDTGTALERRSAPARFNCPEGPLAGPRRRSSRATGRGDVDQQRIDCPPRNVRSSTLPAGRGYRAGDRSDPARPRPAQGGSSEGRPSRQPDLVDQGVPGRRAAAGRDRFGWRSKPVRPPGGGDTGPDRNPRCTALSDRSERERRGHSRRKNVDPSG
jgi:hypothetical protein